MSMLSPICSIWVFFSLSYFVVVSGSAASWCPHHFLPQSDQQFEQKTNRFWEFEEQSNSWVEVDLPYDLISCVNDNCTKVGSIVNIERHSDDVEVREEFNYKKKKKKKKKGSDEGAQPDDMVLPLRKRVSLIGMSETSIWVTGESGSIYERFWNGVQWVIAPHDLPLSAGFAVSVFFVNHSILALSEAGNLYQMQLSENSQPVWVLLMPAVNQIASKESEQNSAIQLKSGVISHDGE